MTQNKNFRLNNKIIREIIKYTLNYLYMKKV